jgi:hypothetical protein
MYKNFSSHPGVRLSRIDRWGGHPFLGTFHNPWQPDRKGRAAAGLARHRDVAAHHLTKSAG